MIKVGKLRAMGIIIIAFGILIGISTLSISTAKAASGPCVGGSHIATQADVDSVTSGGIIVGVTVVCNTDSNTVSADVGQAKEYLTSILRGGKCGPYTTNAAGLDPKFAICAARFLKDARAKDSNIYIASMYRSSAHQAYLCSGRCGVVNGPCAPAGSSKHQSGLAIDISNGQYILPGWIQAMGRGYGVQFPVRNDSGHMEPISGSNCADANFKPSDTVGNLTTGGSLSDQIRRSLGMQQQPPPPPPQPIAEPQPTLPPQSTPSNQTNTTPSPLSPEVPRITPISDIINNNTNTNTNTNGKATSSATSSYDLLDEYRDLISDSIDIGKPVDISLNPDTKDAASLGGRRPTSTLNASGTLASQTLSVPQTFTSNDLANSPVSGYIVGQNTFVLQVLDAMKNALLVALNYLKPFGGGGSSPLVGE